ncbi:MAG: cysteine desulfurase [Bacteroides sp.]|nr:MAG: cysteine desulfurase [Bacteroides sp.]
MSSIYLDNASSTLIDKKVLQVMQEKINIYGNPSSIHSHGRIAKAEIENSRNIISDILDLNNNQILFTSGGTESNNMAIYGVIESYAIKNIITSNIEHLSVLNYTKFISQKYNIKITYIKVDLNGNIDYQLLYDTLKNNYNNKISTLVSIMHANNEIGNIYDIKSIGIMCRKYNAIYHCDTIQTIGHLKIDDLFIKNTDIITCSGHKIHGPKGIGFICFNRNIQILPILLGGNQENNIRSGTENFIGIIGLAKALEISYNSIDKNINHISNIKSYMINQLTKNIINIKFNGNSNFLNKSIHTILNVVLPIKKNLGKDIIMYMDINNISVSNGSACNSGANNISHVINHINHENIHSSIRFSFSKFTNKYEIDKSIKVLTDLL